MCIQMFTFNRNRISGKTLGDWFGKVHFIYKSYANDFSLSYGLPLSPIGIYVIEEVKYL